MKLYNVALSPFAARSAGKAPSRTISARVRPATKSIEKYGCPSRSPTSWPLPGKARRS